MVVEIVVDTFHLSKPDWEVKHTQRWATLGMLL